MQMIRLAAAIGAIALCAASMSATSYEDATRATLLTHDRYLIEVRGNKHTGNADVMRYENFKASEVCPRGYIVEQQGGGVRDTGGGAVAYQCGNSTCAVGWNDSVADAAIVVHCTH